MVKMGLSAQNASDILGLPLGADVNSIVMRYKQLSIKWHPEKHKHSQESQKNFKQVALAYKRLTVKSFQKDLNISECLSLFQQIVFNRPATSNGRKHSCSDSSDNSEDEDESEDSEDEQKESNSLSKSNSKSENPGANDLTEQEKEQSKAQKRRLKKKRQKERKRLEKEQQTNSSNGKPKKSQKSSSTAQEINNVINRVSSSDEDCSFDPNSAFFKKVVSKKRKGAPGTDLTVKQRTVVEKKSDDEGEEVIHPKVLRSRQLAIRGNEMAQMDEYIAAIQLFSEAINLEPSDFRFFGNRSYCYDRIEQYDKALRDAEKAISLDKDWPKGYFRKGRALAGLKRFAESEKAFMQVLKLDKNCDDAVTELLHVRTHQLMDMGFSRHLSEEAIKSHGSVQAALDSLLASVGDNTVSDLYITDDEDENEGFSVHRPAPIPPPTSNPTDVKMDPTNPEGLTALWVGNVLPSVTEKRLNQLFSKFGQVTSVRPLPDKYCAFINFKTKESAGRAMHQLQGTEIDGQKLLIKFPDNPLTSGTSNVTTIRKPQNNTAAAAAAAKQGVRNTPKQSGPVNGDECYFWRTTGCTFGGECKWQHLPNSRGVDKKPWQK